MVKKAYASDGKVGEDEGHLKRKRACTKIQAMMPSKLQASKELAVNEGGEANLAGAKVTAECLLISPRS